MQKKQQCNNHTMNKDATSKGAFGWKLKKFENFFGEVLLYDIPFEQYLCAIKGGL